MPLYLPSGNACYKLSNNLPSSLKITVFKIFNSSHSGQKDTKPLAFIV
jgi:hypothetical protein